MSLAWRSDSALSRSIDDGHRVVPSQHIRCQTENRWRNTEREINIADQKTNIKPWGMWNYCIAKNLKTYLTTVWLHLLQPWILMSPRWQVLEIVSCSKNWMSEKIRQPLMLISHSVALNTFVKPYVSPFKRAVFLNIPVVVIQSSNDVRDRRLASRISSFLFGEEIREIIWKTKHFSRKWLFLYRGSAWRKC